MPLRQAVLLGLLHGPAELAPVSSSGHTILLAWSRRWSHDALDPAARKRFEVALHAGTTAALLLTERRELAAAVRHPGSRGPAPMVVVVVACVPPAVVGALLREPIERRLGTPAGIAAALAGGSVAMAIAERRGARSRARGDAGVLDALALGAAQTVALMPGVSRSGATRTVARWRGFAPAEAGALSAAVGLPVTVGALALKGTQALRGEDPDWAALGTGALASFASALAAGAVMARVGGRRSLLPYAGYRAVLAAAVVRRLRQNAPR